MRISWKASGGGAAPGLGRPHEVDVDALAPDVRREIVDLLAKAHFYELTAAYDGNPPSARDIRIYTITVEDGGRSHTVRRADPIEDAGLAALVNWLRARPEA